jgi:hypothetical protein
MKKVFILLVLTMITIMLSPSTNQAQGRNNKVTNVAAKPVATGDEVWVVVNVIKADKREQFEKFVFEIFWPAAKKLSLDDQKAFKATRVLTPTQANEDGTYSYLFIMDPVIPGVDYSIEKFLIKMYGKEKAAEYGKMFDETYDRPQISYSQKQSPVH